jgi:Lon protease-like protein
MSERKEIALFPLRIVAFPGSRVDLQIFERRYIDLVTQSMKSDTGFGICLLKQGDAMADIETKQTIHRTGTCVKIADWDQLESGLVDLLESLERHPLVEQKNLIIDYDNLWDLGWRLSDLMPLDAEQKQDLLELDDPWQRIEKIEEIVSRLANEV